MQFHLNGCRTGDPSIREAQPLQEADETQDVKVDVLIVGCGPAGLTLAAQLAAFPDIRTMIIERKEGPLRLGQADGIACRTMEMFQAFGFAGQVEREAYWVNETTFWNPDPARPGHIACTGRIQDTEDGLSEFPHVILNQARIHDFYLEVMRGSPSRLAPDYGRRLAGLTVDRSRADHPVVAFLEHIDGAQAGTTQTVAARYVVGCDGARSAVRAALGNGLHGDSANQAWGVMDVLAVSDFPDIRLKAAIHSASEGSMLIIPREGGYLVRFYIELDELNEDERVSARNITANQLVAVARRILHPFTLDVKEIAWWSVYEIGQRLCDRFDDVDAGSDLPPRVFIAGDACHTHSPKAGQGMNVSMQDSFNLGWKLASVLRGAAHERILATYSQERQAVALELIDFDRAFARMFSTRPRTGEGDGDGLDPAEFQDYFVRQGRFTAGTATCYAPSLLTGGAEHQALATGFAVGTRFHSAPVIRYADARPMQLGHVIEADGRWRLFAFEGRRQVDGINRLCDFLTGHEMSPLRRTPAGEDVDAVIDLRAVFQAGHRELARDRLHGLLLPEKGRYGLIDHEKVFCPDLKAAGGDIFDLRGIDRGCGCLVVVRPDQYVAQVLPLDGYRALADYFAGFMTHGSVDPFRTPHRRFDAADQNRFW